MTTPYVTIGGREVYSTPRGDTLNLTPAARAPDHPADTRAGLTALTVVAFAALGFLVLLITWLSRRRHRR